MRAAGVVGSLRVNVPYSNSAVNVYVTGAKERDVTGCRPGDARYDATSDVIVLDENVVWPVSTSVQYAGVGITHGGHGTRAGSSKIWLHFAFLHELGHRTLHRGIRMRFRRRAPSTIEAEADVFALAALGKLAATGTYDGDAQYGVIHGARRCPGERDE